MKKFLWENNSFIGGTTLIDDTLPSNNNMAYHVTTNIEDVTTCRKELCNFLNLNINNFVLPQQTHSDIIVKVTSNDYGKGSTTHDNAIAIADALYTFDKDVILGVFHADCVPILLIDETTNMICAIHSGTVGTIKEITLKSINTIINNDNINPNNIKAYVGPCISKENCIINKELITKVQSMSFDTTNYISYIDDNNANLDNLGLTLKQLIIAGLDPKNINIAKIDTFTNSDICFSFKRDNTCGRHLTFIVNKS